MHPITQSILDSADKIEKLRKTVENTTSKLWRLQTQLFKEVDSINLSFKKFEQFLDKEVLNGQDKDNKPTV